MPAGLTAQQISVFTILILAFALLLTELIRNDVVAVLIILALYVTGLLNARQALSGFGSEPAITVAGIFVVSAALEQTGLAGRVGELIGRLAGASYSRAIAVTMPAVAVFSAFTHHVTTTAIMVPVTLNLARERGIPAAKLLIPVSFAASLGTTITIIGAPAFVIASGVLQRAGQPGLGIFSIAPVGLALSALGTVYVLLVGRFLLPAHAGTEGAEDRFRLDHYFTELRILEGSPYLQKTVGEIDQSRTHQFDVLGWLRGRRHVPRPYGEERLQVGDVLLVRTTPEDLVAIRQEQGVELNPVVQYGDQVGGAKGDVEEIGERLVQAVVAPGSDLVGRTIGRVNFRERYGAIVVALWRRSAWLQQELAAIRLNPGDVLVFQGDDAALARVRRDRAFLMMVPFAVGAQARRKAPLAGLIMLATVLLAAFNVLSIEMAALAGAVAVVLTRCLSGRQAYRSIDARIYVFIAGAIPLGDALQSSGASELIARWLQAAVGGWSRLLILLLIFGVVSVLTQFMSDAATTALFGPVAVALAHGLGHRPEQYVVTVAMASVAAFLTPIGHHGNLLVYGPGQYQFSDFVKVGTPLTILVGLVVCLMAPMLWPG